MLLELDRRSKVNVSEVNAKVDNERYRTMEQQVEDFKALVAALSAMSGKELPVLQLWHGWAFCEGLRT